MHRGSTNLFGYYILLITGLVLFTVTAVMAANHQTQAADNSILLFFRKPDNLLVPIGPKWLLPLFEGITVLGNASLLITVSIIAVTYFILKKIGRLAGIFLTIAAGAVISELTLKEFFARPRPAIVPHLVNAEFYSFPSGHSMMSVVVYSTLALLLIYSGVNEKLKIYFISAAFILPFAIGLSRVYLGVHYPTDIIAGWALGIVWLSLCRIITSIRSPREGT